MWFAAAVGDRHTGSVSAMERKVMSRDAGVLRSVVLHLAAVLRGRGHSQAVGIRASGREAEEAADSAARAPAVEVGEAQAAHRADSGRARVGLAGAAASGDGTPDRVCESMT